MIITILLVVISIVLIVVGIRLYQNYNADDLGIALIFIGGFIGGLCLLVGLTIILTVQIPTQTDYENMMYEGEVLQIRLDNIDNNTVGNELLYQDIISFNQTIHRHIKWSNNLWVNWFWNQKIKDIPMIDIPGVEYR